MWLLRRLNRIRSRCIELRLPRSPFRGRVSLGRGSQDSRSLNKCSITPSTVSITNTQGEPTPVTTKGEASISHGTVRGEVTIPPSLRGRVREVAGPEERSVRPERPLTRSISSEQSARLPHFVAAWEQVTGNNFILQIVRDGYRLDFVSEPYQESFSPRPMSRNTINICNKKVTQFLLHGTIVETQPSHDQFYSEIFPVAKKSLKDHRIILDLSDLNLFVRKLSFKMESLYSIMYMIRPGDYFISIDIKDAYYSIAIHILSRPYLTFIFLGIYYQFTCLPQGLSSAPRIFTRVMRVVLGYLRTFGIRVAAWLDDLLLAAASASLAAAHTTKALGTLRELGFVPNMEKSVLTPSQRIEHLGLVWDSVSYSVSVPQSKLIEVKRKCRLALSRRVSLRLLSSILGSIEFFRWGFTFAAVYYRGLQRHVNACLAGGLSYNSVVLPSTAAKSDLQWWADAGDSLPPRSLAPFSASLILYADASLQGWGGWCDDGRDTLGSWSAEESELHINVLKMRAVYYLFRCFFASASN